jgi:hypothetical protein
VLWFLCRYKDAVVITTAPTWTQVERLLWGDIHKIVESAVISFPRDALRATELRLSKTRYALGLSTDKGVRFQGWHGTVLIVIDEAPGVRPDIFEAIEGIRAGGDVRVLMLGNPTQIGGPFYDAFEKDANLWKRFTISAFDTPNFTDLPIEKLRETSLDDEILQVNARPYLTTRHWVRERLQKWGESHPLWRARVLGEFPTETRDNLIPLSFLDNARFTTSTVSEEDHYVAGVDVAGAGGDETVVVVRRGGRIVDIGVWEDSDPREKVCEFLERYRSRLQLVNVDSIGLGYYFALHLRDHGFIVQEVNVGESARNPEDYANLRAELYWALRMRFVDGHIYNLKDDELYAQLATIRYEENPRGQIRIESKEEASRRGVSSPDRADALMLAFCPILREKRDRPKLVLPASFTRSSVWNS